MIRVALAVASRFAVARDGNVAILFALAAIPLIGSAGLALDAGRAYLVERRLASALDAASLAAVQVNFLDRAESDARNFFDANYPDDYLRSDIVSFDYRTLAEDEIIEISVTATVPTTLMQILGRDEIRVSRATTAQRLVRGLEIALVMDITGSMEADGRIGSMKAAADELVNILAGRDRSMRNTWISVVPYASTVNIGTGNADWLVDSTTVEAAGDGSSPYGDTGWAGCVEARHGGPSDDTGRDETDQPPDASEDTSTFRPHLFASESDNLYDIDDPSTIREGPRYGNGAAGPNLGCGTPIVPLTNDRDVLRDYIDSMRIAHRGGTMSNLGMVWGWRTISPRWRGLWPDLDRVWENPEGEMRSLPLSYDEPLMSKAIVILTDGLNSFYDWPYRYVDYDDREWVGETGPEGSDYTAYGRLNQAVDEPERSNPRDWLDEKLLRVCNAAKESGVEVYTITFGTGIDRTTRSVFENCASDGSKYFHAPSGSDLRSTFRTIGSNLSRTRLVR